jgi:hypothetical protein
MDLPLRARLHPIFDSIMMALMMASYVRALQRDRRPLLDLDSLCFGCHLNGRHKKTQSLNLFLVLLFLASMPR